MKLIRSLAPHLWRGGKLAILLRAAGGDNPAFGRARNALAFRLRLCLVFTPLLLVLGCGSTQARAASFDAGRVIDDTAAQCDFGPRIPGTPAHAAARDWIRSRMEAAGLRVEVQPFTAELALTASTAPAWNLWGSPKAWDGASAPPGGKDVILLSAHWDTRPWADEEPEGSPTTPFLGANDGAAGVAFILELLRQIQGTDMADRVAVVFFDAEDSGVSGDPESWCKGSHYAAAHPPAWMSRVALGINFDMIAHPGLELRREAYSLEAAPGAVERLWRIGRDLAPRVFIDETRGAVIDDHLPFIRAGYAYIDLIGLPNAHWHRTSDLPGNLDRASIRQVGLVLLEFLPLEFLRMSAP